MGEGGGIATNNPKIARAVRSLRDWGRDCFCETGENNPNGACNNRFNHKFEEIPDGYDHKYIHSNIGYNLKPLDLQCAIGLEQLKKLPEFSRKRKENFKKLYETFLQYQDKVILPSWSEKADVSWFVLEWNRFRVDRGNRNITGDGNVFQTINELVNVSRSFRASSFSSTGAANDNDDSVFTSAIYDENNLLFKKDTALESQNVSWQAIEIIEIIPPVVDLIAPGNNSQLNSSLLMQFNFSVNDSSVITNCSLYGSWAGGWHMNQTTGSPVRLTTLNFSSVDVESDGTYKWNVFCIDEYIVSGVVPYLHVELSFVFTESDADVTFDDNIPVGSPFDSVGGVSVLGGVYAPSISCIFVRVLGPASPKPVV